MKSYIFITETGCDPQLGRPVKDPILRGTSSLGACRPDIRRRVVPGDHIFVVSGKVSGAQQYVIGGLEVAEKMSAIEAFSRYPSHRLRRDDDGGIRGNIVCSVDGMQHSLDHHTDFHNRVENYVIGRNAIEILGDRAIAVARLQTLEFLRFLLGKKGETPYSVMGRASRLDQTQTEEMVHWLSAIRQIR